MWQCFLGYSCIQKYKKKQFSNGLIHTGGNVEMWLWYCYILYLWCDGKNSFEKLTDIYLNFDKPVKSKDI